ncbi:MAG: glycosyltransferase family 4 protein [Armatimonadetes bacterium]|nr:glycosyltransferase family 4 protein [Armatimonadota bacterium]
MRTLLLIPSKLKTNIEAQIADNTHPRMDYFALQEKLNPQNSDSCVIIDYTEVEGSRHPVVGVLRKMFGNDFALAYMGFRAAKQYDAVFTNGENVGLPLALLWKFLGGGASRPAHVTIGHRLSTGKKRLFFRTLGLHAFMDAILVYARTQETCGREELKIPAEKLRLIAFHADTRFFAPQGNAVEPDQICSAGLEWRDYPTLIRAVEQTDDLLVKLAAASPWSKHQNETEKRELPAHIEAKRYSYAELRELYEQSAFVVVPLYENDFQAGVTTILEAMAVGKCVVVTRTEGQTDVVTEGETGLYVPPGDTEAWRTVIAELRHDPVRCERIGLAAREWVEQNASLDRWADTVTQTIQNTVSVRQKKNPGNSAGSWVKWAWAIVLLVLLPSIVGNYYLYRRFSSNRVVVRSGEKAVTYRQYRDALEAKYGRETLRRLVLTRIIADAAVAAGVYPTGEEVTAYSRNLERTTPYLYEVQRLKAEGSDTLLRQEMASLLALENLRIRDVTVTDAEARAWWKKYREKLALPVQVATIMVTTPARDPERATKVRALLREKIPPYIIAREPETRVIGVGGYEPDWENMSPEAAILLNETIFRMQPGQIISVRTPGTIYTVRLLSRGGGGAEQFRKLDTPPAALRARVTRLARLAKAPPSEVVMAQIYKEARVTWEITPYSAYLNDLETAVTAPPSEK